MPHCRTRFPCHLRSTHREILHSLGAHHHSLHLSLPIRVIDRYPAGWRGKPGLAETVLDECSYDVYRTFTWSIWPVNGKGAR